MEKVKRQESLYIDVMSQALEDLMLEKPFAKITVSEIVEKSGIGRPTFYRNFESKEDILRRRCNKITTEWIEQESVKIPNPSDEKAFDEFSLKLFRFWYDHQKNIRLLIQNDLVHILEEITENRIKEDLQNESNIYEIDFIIGGLFRVLKNWTVNGCKDSPEEVVKSIKRIA